MTGVRAVEARVTAVKAVAAMMAAVRRGGQGVEWMVVGWLGGGGGCTVVGRGGL